ncbi:mannose-1-phosphate guanylyltransferase [Halobaculum sp. MBLA0147]|uniref:mannose-1-phosphate guanylyltransferase n=1 Tax=Halobaculum sp. MBLA0147 TaxID=3079934 RepID=UPI0035268851
MDRPVVAVVLAGGTGTRLYPAARSDRPKQFLPLGGERSLLARTLDRTGFADATVVATRERFADAVRERAPTATVLTEPEPKDTGPAMLYATHRVRELAAAGELPVPAHGPEPVVAILPADHHVPDATAFERTLATGVSVAAETERLVTFGVEPTRPETGYGYVEPGADRGAYHDLVAFHEKPDAETAEQFRADGYRWNAGIFAWTPTALFAAAEGTPLAPMLDPLADGEPAAAFDAVEPVSVDYAVMERTDRAAVVPADFAWDDLGSWDALERLGERDDDGNALHADAVTVDATGNVVAGDAETHVSLVGVDDLCVVAYDDRVLVVPKAESQRVREVVAELRESDEF